MVRPGRRQLLLRNKATIYLATAVHRVDRLHEIRPVELVGQASYKLTADDRVNAICGDEEVAMGLLAASKAQLDFLGDVIGALVALEAVGEVDLDVRGDVTHEHALDLGAVEKEHLPCSSRSVGLEGAVNRAVWLTVVFGSDLLEGDPFGLVALAESEG